jgi:hypothetical protein
LRVTSKRLSFCSGALELPVCIRKDMMSSPLFPLEACVRNATRAAGIVLCLVMTAAGLSVRSRAADDTEIAPAAVDAGSPEVSRDAWRQRVEEAKRRSRDVAQERREHPELYAPVPDDPETVATERLLNDESLRNGDIVSTKNGLFLYRGAGDLPRRSEDFVRIPRRQ